MQGKKLFRYMFLANDMYPSPNSSLRSGFAPSLLRNKGGYMII